MEVYWRIYLVDGIPTPVCMQEFDEKDYDQMKFLNKEQYTNEQAATIVITLETIKSINLLSALGYEVKKLPGKPG